MDGRSAGLVCMHPLKTTTFTLAGVAVLLLIAVQFLPWATFEASGSTPDFNFGGFGIEGSDYRTEVEANTWDQDVTTSTNGGSERTSDESWYDDSQDDAAGITQMRAAIPILLVATVAVLVGGLLVMANPTMGSVIAIIGGTVLTAAVILFAVGLNLRWDDVAYEWSLSFYFAITACACAIASGVTGLMAGNATGKATF